ncbi:hypothetical protein HN011_011594 [Eciton burchellii]|nr:hypothetical protein HN011_011594 [Eciton burchellii]
MQIPGHLEPKAACKSPLGPSDRPGEPPLLNWRLIPVLLCESPENPMRFSRDGKPAAGSSGSSAMRSLAKLNPRPSASAFIANHPVALWPFPYPASRFSNVDGNHKPSRIRSRVPPISQSPGSPGQRGKGRSR